jgi:hypothetical protein
VISGFLRKVDETSAFLGYCAACSGNSLPTIRDRPLKMGPIGCLETSVRNCHHTLRNSLEERSSLLQKGKVVPVYTIQACRGRRSIAPLILSLCTEWRWVFNFTPRPLYPREREPAPLVQLAGWAGLDGCGKSHPLLAGFDPQTIQLVASRYSATTLCYPAVVNTYAFLLWNRYTGMCYGITTVLLEHVIQISSRWNSNKL